MLANTSEVSSFEGKQRKPKGAVLFTGPDGLRDHRVKVEDQCFVGNTTKSPEASGDLRYLYRAAEASGCFIMSLVEIMHRTMLLRNAIRGSLPGLKGH